jgi:hypothetical protein
VLGVAIISVMALYGAGALVNDNDVVNDLRGGDFLSANISTHVQNFKILVRAGHIA